MGPTRKHGATRKRFTIDCVSGHALLIRVAGCQIDAVETDHMTDPKPLTYMFQGSAMNWSSSLGHADLTRLRVPAGLFDRTSDKPMDIAATPRAFNLGLVHPLLYG